jgi:hypothetical protein
MYERGLVEMSSRMGDLEFPVFPDLEMAINPLASPAKNMASVRKGEHHDDEVFDLG